MKPIFATCPINVSGRLYQAGEEITCGSGARTSLLRQRHAIEGEGEVSTPQAPPVPPSESDSEPTLEPLVETDPDPNAEATPLTELLLDADIVAKLASHQLTTIEQLQAFLDSGKKLRKLSGIGDATENKVLFALQVFDQPDV